MISGIDKLVCDFFVFRGWKLWEGIFFDVGKVLMDLLVSVERIVCEGGDE